MAITIKDITELPTGTPLETSPIIYGQGTNLFTTTLGYILSQVTAGITDLTYQVIDTNLFFFSGSGNILNAVFLDIDPGEITFIQIEIQTPSGVVTKNTYLVPIGAGSYQPLGNTLTLDQLVLVDKQPVGGNPSGSNTVTYVSDSIALINLSNPALDFSDTSKVYFVDLDSGFFRFIGTAGLYGDGQLQMVQSDLEELFQETTGVYFNTNLATETIGGFLEGEPITPPQGLTFTSMWDKLFSSIILPTISFNVNNQIVEIGSSFSQTINIIYTQNDAGDLISYSLLDSGISISNSQSTTFLKTNILVSFTLQGFVTYSAGNGISSGTISTPIRTITPKYKYWVYSGADSTSPIVSSNIRALTTNGFVPANNVSVVIPQGDTEVSIYLKQTSTLQSVIYVESSNANITANFTETLVTVNDANGTAVQYKKLTQKIGGTGYTANATYLITITE